MKLYVGVQTELDHRVMVTSSTGQFDDYALSADRDGHSENFAWGAYPKEIAISLALAILADHAAGGARDPRIGERLADTLLAALPAKFWVLSEREVAAAITQLSAEAN